MSPFILPVKIPCRDGSKDMSVSRTPLPEIKPNLCVISPHGANAIYHISASPLLLLFTASSSLSTPIHPHLQPISTYPESAFNTTSSRATCLTKLWFT